LTSDASVVDAVPAVSDTRLWTVKTSSAIPLDADPTTSTAAAIATAAVMRRVLRNVLPFALE
jgi:hypothetical protein